jgi:pimeloyl-ACP methyl ester carboxylesterase
MPWSNQGGGGPWGSGPKGPWGSGPQSGGGAQPPDLEDLLRRSQDRLKTVLPGGSFGGKVGIVAALVVALFLWGISGFFVVQPGELGVVMRFGAYVRDAPAGWGYTWPYPIGAVQKVNIERIHRIDVGMRIVDDARRGTTTPRDVPEESLMLTGDENIVDVDFAVLWKIKSDGGAGQFLFNIQYPEGTVKAVAESAMREVVGRSNIQPILTGARQNIENAVQELMQKTLDVRKTRRRPTPTASCRKPAVAPRRSCRMRKPIASRPWRKPRARPRASTRSIRNTPRRRRSRVSVSISRPWSVCSAAPTRSFSIKAVPGRADRRWFRICRSIRPGSGRLSRSKPNRKRSSVARRRS